MYRSYSRYILTVKKKQNKTKQTRVIILYPVEFDLPKLVGQPLRRDADGEIKIKISAWL